MIERERLDGILFAIMGDEHLLEQWWNRPNAVFDQQTPLAMFEHNPERVRDWIFKAANLGEGAD